MGATLPVTVVPPACKDWCTGQDPLSLFPLLQNVTFSVDHPSIAIASSRGLVHGLALGKTLLRAAVSSSDATTFVEEVRCLVLANANNCSVRIPVIGRSACGSGCAGEIRRVSCALQLHFVPSRPTSFRVCSLIFGLPHKCLAHMPRFVEGSNGELPSDSIFDRCSLQ